jgi:ABC-type phosphate/phosphonate transport system substrate-binding protein
MLVAGCRRAANVQATAIRAATSTPRSTPLPPVPTAIPVGAENNPILMAFANPGGTRTQSAVENAAEALAEALSTETGLTVEVSVVDTAADAVAALCDSSRVSVAWLNGLAYAAAHAANCGAPALQVERGTGRNATTGEAVQLIANAETGAASIADLADRTFCRVGYTDFYTWIVPSMMLRTAGIDPAAEIGDVTDVDDSAAVVEAVNEGDCDAAGLSATDFEDFADGDAGENINTIGQPVTIPYAILTYPPELPLGVRWTLTDSLLAIADDPEQQDALETLLDMDGLERVEESDFNPLINFVRSTGVQLAAGG